MSTDTRSPARQALSHRDFARYASARLTATLSWQMLDVVLNYQVWKLTESKFALGFIGLSQFLPFVLLLLPGGQMADRLDRRLVILCAYAVEFLGATVLLVFTLLGGKNPLVCFGET